MHNLLSNIHSYDVYVFVQIDFALSILKKDVGPWKYIVKYNYIHGENEI